MGLSKMIPYIKIIFIKTTLYVAILIGNIIRYFRGNKNIDLNKINKIIFNRKDRLGDAVITKPFIILFSNYIKYELKLDIEIVVECSKYNEFIFKEGGNHNYKLNSELREISNEGMHLGNFMFNYIKSRFKGLRTKINSKKNKKNLTVYVDLVGDIDSIIKNLNIGCYIIGGNMLFNNYLLDFSLKNNYISLNKNNLIKTYIDLVTSCFSLKNFEKYIYDNIEEFYPEYRGENKQGILIFLGNKEYRNLEVNIWKNIILSVKNKYSKENIYVIDDNSNIVYDKLIEWGGFTENIHFIKNDMSLKDFKDYAKKFKLLIGIDGGGFNYIRTVGDSITIYTIGNKDVWSVFTGNNKYIKKHIGNNRYLKECKINDKYFGYIYKESFFLPTFDCKLNKKFFYDIPNFIEMI